MPYPAVFCRPAPPSHARRATPWIVLLGALAAASGASAEANEPATPTTPGIGTEAQGAVTPGQSLSVPSQPRAAALRPLPGLEINYDLLAEPGASAGPARLEGVVAGSHGQLLTSVLVNPVGLEGERVARLDTAWSGPESMPVPALVVGDTYGSGGGWSRPVRFGGVRFGRGLMLRPGFAAAPQPVYDTAALPSSVEAAGLQLAPAWAGAAGQPRITLPGASLPEVAGHQPAIGTPGALQAGASDYEVEAGRLRSGWGTAEDRYDQGYAAGAYRRGLGAGFTAEARGEWTPSRLAAGLEMSSALGAAGTVRAVVAQSATPEQSGLRWGMGYVRSAEGTTWTVAWDEFERGFTQLGAPSGEAPPRGRVEAGASLPLWGKATAGLSYSHQRSWDASSASVLGLEARMPLPLRSSLAVSYSLRPGAASTYQQPAWKAGVTVTVPLKVLGPGS